MDLLERFAGVNERLKHRQEVNGIVGDWAAQYSRDELMRQCEAGDVPLGPINTIADIFEDEHIRARKTLETRIVPGEGPVTVPGVVPRLRSTPGRIDTLGPTLGQHNEEIYCGLLGLSADELQQLRDAGVV